MTRRNTPWTPHDWGHIESAKLPFEKTRPVYALEVLTAQSFSVGTDHIFAHNQSAGHYNRTATNLQLRLTASGTPKIQGSVAESGQDKGNESLFETAWRHYLEARTEPPSDAILVAETPTVSDIPSSPSVSDEDASTPRAPSSAVKPVRARSHLAEILTEQARVPEDPRRLRDALLALDPEEPPIFELIASEPLHLTLPDGSEPEHGLHPQGLTPAETENGERVWVLTAVEVVEKRANGVVGSPGTPHDPSVNGRGRAWLFVLDSEGRPDPTRTRELQAEDGSFHPSGIDAHGKDIYVALSRYYPNPNSKSEVWRVRIGPPFIVEPLFTIGDHLGFVTFEPSTETLVASNWTADRWYGLEPNGSVRWITGRVSDLAVEDGQSLGDGWIATTGASRQPSRPRDLLQLPRFGLGLLRSLQFGLDLIRVEDKSLVVHRSFRWSTLEHLTAQQNAPFDEASHLWADRNGIWALVVPDNQYGPWASRDHGAPDHTPDKPDPLHGRYVASLQLYRLRPVNEQATSTDGR